MSNPTAEPKKVQTSDKRTAHESSDTCTPEPLGIYVHFPWCLNKCPYCDFLSVAAERPEIPHAAYATAVIRELDRRARGLTDRPVRSIFFGGGTPSLWEPDELGRVLEAIEARFESDGAEVTVECNPSSFDRARATSLRAAGVNRVSIGVQGLDEERLRFLGRLHDGPRALASVRTAIDVGLPRVNADLIFGVAAQPPEQAIDEAERVAALGLTHLSVYALTIEPGTSFGALAKKGRLPLLDESHVAESFVGLDERLTSLGFEHYEISNYARRGEVAVHNVSYWRGRDYLGLGCGAWGTVTRERRFRYRNTPSPERYLALTDEWATAPDIDSEEIVAHGEHIDDETALSERIMLGLRLAEGIDFEEITRDLDVVAWTRARLDAAEALAERGRLLCDGNRLRLPKHAWLFADGTISELM